MQTALHAATVMLPHLRRGLSEESAARRSSISGRSPQASAVALGDRDHVLALEGLGDDHHAAGDALIPVSCGPRARIACTSSQQIHCEHAGCPLGPAIAHRSSSAGARVGSFVALFARGRRISPTTPARSRRRRALCQRPDRAVRARGPGRAARARRAARAAGADLAALHLQRARGGRRYIHSSPEEARELLTDFAEFTRYAFRGQHPYVTLADELHYVEKYLRLERARFGDQLQCGIQVAPEVLHAVVPVLCCSPWSRTPCATASSAAAWPHRDHRPRRRRGRGAARARRRRRHDAGSRRRGSRGNGGGIGLAQRPGPAAEHLRSGYGLELDTADGEGTTVTMTLPKFRAGVRAA